MERIDRDNNTRTRLSVGDAIVVVTFLSFIVGWVCLFVFSIDEDSMKDPTWVEQAGVAFGLIIPPVWAMGKINNVVDKRATE